MPEEEIPPTREEAYSDAEYNLWHDEDDQPLFYTTGPKRV